MDNVTEAVIAKHDDGNVHQVVGNQYGGQRAFGVFPQFHYFAVYVAMVRIQF